MMTTRFWSRVSVDDMGNVKEPQNEFFGIEKLTQMSPDVQDITKQFAHSDQANQFLKHLAKKVQEGLMCAAAGNRLEVQDDMESPIGDDIETQVLNDVGFIFPGKWLRIDFVSVFHSDSLGETAPHSSRPLWRMKVSWHDNIPKTFQRPNILFDGTVRIPGVKVLDEEFRVFTREEVETWRTNEGVKIQIKKALVEVLKEIEQCSHCRYCQTGMVRKDGGSCCSNCSKVWGEPCKVCGHYLGIKEVEGHTHWQCKPCE